MSEPCQHTSLIVVKHRVHFDEFCVEEGKAKRAAWFTAPPDNIRVRCRRCGLDLAYDSRIAPAWIESAIEQVTMLEKEEERAQLLDCQQWHLASAGGDIDLLFLDELLDADVDPNLLIGKIANWHGQPSPIVRLKNGMIALEIELTCSKCAIATEKAYVCSGLHTGAFCYIHSFEGEYQANLRDEVFVCEACSAIAHSTPL